MNIKLNHKGFTISDNFIFLIYETECLSIKSQEKPNSKLAKHVYINRTSNTIKDQSWRVCVFQLFTSKNEALLTLVFPESFSGFGRKFQWPTIQFPIYYLSQSYCEKFLLCSFKLKATHHLLPHNQWFVYCNHLEKGEIIKRHLNWLSILTQCID